MKFPAALKLPQTLLFDWHGTLVDTVDAMYNALDELFIKLARMGILNRLTHPENARNLDDAKLIHYVRKHQHLHPKVRAARKISRTDIFEVLFGDDEEAKAIAHEYYNRCYRKHCGEVHPMEPGLREHLLAFKQLGLTLGIASNRNREFLGRELRLVDQGRWQDLFDSVTCGDEISRRKPAPDILLQALEELGQSADASRWYIGDSITDTASAKLAGITACFYNGAHWDQPWLRQIFPGTPAHPHVPDVFVETHGELLDLIKSGLAHYSINQTKELV